MDYRSPIFSMQRELEALEAELAALHALPPAQPRRAQKKNKTARDQTQRETHALRKSLKKIAQQIEERSVALGVRELTPGEVACGRTMRRIALGCIAIGALVMAASVAVASSRRLVWTETTCTFEDDRDGDWVASYRAGGHTQTFGASRDDSGRVPCWVPGPSVLSGVGRLEKPSRPAVPLREKLSVGWSIFAGTCVFLGLFLLGTNASDERKRKRREIQADVYEAAD